MPSFTSRGTTCAAKLRKCASITFSGIWQESKWKPCCAATSSIRR